MNAGLSCVRTDLVCFLDADVILRGGEISAALEALQVGDAEVVTAGYGRADRPNPFPIFTFGGGWFLAGRTSLFRELGGFPSDFVEDAAMTNRIKRSGHTIKRLPFNVEVRRGPRNPIVKALTAMFTR